MLFHVATFKRRCKQYLPGDIQCLSPLKIIQDNIYVVDLDLDDVPKLLFVDIMKFDGVFNKLHSTIKFSSTLLMGKKLVHM